MDTLSDLYTETGNGWWLLKRYNWKCRKCVIEHDQDMRAGLKPVTEEIKSAIIAKCHAYSPTDNCGAFHLMDNL